MPYRMRRAKKEKIEAFLVIEVRIPKTMINGRIISAKSVRMLVTSREFQKLCYSPISKGKINETRQILPDRCIARLASPKCLERDT